MPAQLTERRVAAIQAGYFVTTGVWPIVAPRSFQLVTGPKADMWLAQTLGGVVAVIGLVLAAAAQRGERTPARLLGVGSALVLGTSDVVFVKKGRISRVYLLDAACDVTLAVGWLYARGRG